MTDAASQPGRTVWIDASVGASGDMLLGALVDAGVPLEIMQQAIDRLDVGVSLRAEPVERAHLGATKVHVDAPPTETARHLPEILELLARLPAQLEDRATAVFTRLGRAEAAVHRIDIDEVHFHEVGALDAIADVVGVVAGLEHLGADRIVCSTLGLGSGSAQAAHGRLPVPVPAVVELVVGVPAAAGPAPFESLTPTGAALLVTVVDDWGPMPEMVVRASGSGAGSKDPHGFANLVRLVVGQAPDGFTGSMVQLEANVDDLDPRLWPTVIDEVMAAGAVDAWVTPITMKKGRPAFTFSALFDESVGEEVRAAVFAHTSTIGVREHRVSRETLDREITTVSVEGHPVRTKVARRKGEVVNRSAEWDDVVAVARKLGRSPKAVLAAVVAMAGEQNPSPPLS